MEWVAWLVCMGLAKVDEGECVRKKAHAAQWSPRGGDPNPPAAALLLLLLLPLLLLLVLLRLFQSTGTHEESAAAALAGTKAATPVGPRRTALLSMLWT